MMFSYGKDARESAARGRRGRMRQAREQYQNRGVAGAGREPGVGL
ncbi:hypothetical protein [Massilia scottii]|nr:hypothetical protein [Massilia sp. CCM 9029]MDQ1834261.1 hypothetical protein [Massilia sp. CCM 9029]